MQFEDLLRAIRESPFFHGMALEEQMLLAQLGKVDVHPVGGVLFRPGETPSAFYLVLDGVVEIGREESSEVGLQPVAYLGEGSTVSESKVITGTTLSSLAHFPEGGTTLRWPRPVLLRHLYSSRDLALHYLQRLARRLEGTIADLGAHSGSNLRGRLDHFDLPAILQTVVDSGATGVLEILDADGRDFGVIHTSSRMIGRILCGDLEGPEAFLEILNSPPKNGTFRFSNLAIAPKTDTYRQVHPLLLEAARVQDELTHFAATVSETSLLQPATHRLAWKGGIDADLVEEIWHQLSSQPCGWGVLAELLPFSRGQIALTVRDMLLAGVLNVDRDHEITNDQSALGG